MILVRFSDRTGQLLVSVQACNKDVLAADDGAAVVQLHVPMGVVSPTVCVHENRELYYLFL